MFLAPPPKKNRKILLSSVFGIIKESHLSVWKVCRVFKPPLISNMVNLLYFGLVKGVFGVCGRFGVFFGPFKSTMGLA